MKAAILTFPNSISYGAVLQMYALYHTVEKMGHDAEIIHYQSTWMRDEKHFTTSRKGGGKTQYLRKQLKRLLHWRVYREFKKFEICMDRYPKALLTDARRLPEVSRRYDAVICGSDQVWNPDITNRDTAYFLDFCGSHTARISYAPSFGVEALPDEFANTVKKELEQFSHLSVRETAGQEIVRQLTQKQAQLVIDPTLLLEEQEWVTQEKVHPAAKGDYVLYYTVRSSDSLWRYCLRLAEQHNLKVLRVGGNFVTKRLKRSDMVEYVNDISPGQWLYLIHHARCVVTNSFHGTAFAINYKKDFFVEFSSLTNSRLSHIVSMLGLEKQVVRSEEAAVSLKTDYAQAESVLPSLRAESFAFLKNALTEVSEKNERK